MELGAEVKAADNEGRTALHLAAGTGDRIMVVRLLQLGSDVKARDGVGGEPFLLTDAFSPFEVRPFDGGRESFLASALGPFC